MSLDKEKTLDPARPLSDAAGRFLAVYDIGRRLLAQAGPREVVATILEAIVEHMKPDRACVLAVAGDGSYRPLACHRLDASASVESWAVSHTALRRAREDGVAVLAWDSVTDPRLAGAESMHRFGIRSVMCVPLGQSPVRGLVYLHSRLARSYDGDNLEFLTAVCLYASLVLERAQEHERTAEALRLSGERLSVLQEELLRHQIVGRSPALVAAYDALKRLARGGARVLLRGETGSGKELFARAYAAHCPRAGGPYVPLPIPALAPTLVESELFGHVKGAFTEAARDKKGRLELAEGGVLFLDEVGDIEPALQVKLLRFLDSGELFRVGDTQPRHVEALVVSATNRRLEKAVEEGRFRADLLARLGHTVTIPPLRERPEDVPLLVEHFLGIHSRGGAPKVFADETLELLKRHAWPFNVRELQQVVERTVCMVDHEVVRPDDLPSYLQGAPEEVPRDPRGFRALKEIVEEAERAHILKALETAGGNKRRAIELLGISSETFYRRLDEFGLRKASP